MEGTDQEKAFAMLTAADKRPGRIDLGRNGLRSTASTRSSPTTASA
jgi:hypothetical protein